MNKRRFKRTLTQNAFYFKAKKSVVMESPANGGRTLFGINANGSQFADPIASAFWRLTAPSGGTQAAIAATDMPTEIDQIYSQVRLAGVKIQWHPAAPNGSLLGAYLPGIIVYDRDGIEGPLRTKTFDTLLENVNGTSTFNMYRPWKRYIKFPKRRINSTIPSMDDHTPLAPNENLAGQWHSVTGGLVQDSTSNFGSHVLLYLPRNSGGSDNESQAQGTLVLTTYWVYKDRV